MQRSPLFALMCALLLACGGEASESPSGPGGSGSGAGGPGGSTGTSSGGSGTGGSGAGTPGDWELLVEGDWSLDPGSEPYTCVVAEVPETTYITAFRPIAPEGTHHTVLTVVDGVPEGTFPCNAGTNGENMIYGSGVGTEEEELPEGVAFKIDAGRKVLLNLHLFNATTSAITGTSGIEIKRLAPEDVDFEATAVLAGPLDINLPPQATTTEVGHCTIPADATLFAIGPHMHQLGNHMTVTLEDAGGDVVLWDGDYTFEDQKHYAVDAELSAGQQVRVECTYNNTTNQTVTWGDSSNAEMCFAGLSMYPADAAFGLICSN